MTELPRVPLNGTGRRVLSPGDNRSGGTPQPPYGTIPHVQTPPGRDESTWPETWEAIPQHCPVCDAPTTPDRHHNSRAGPGWQCGHDPIHFWQVRTAPLRRYLAANPLQQSCYPWYETTEEDRQAWLDAHCHLPRVTPSTTQGGTQHALD
jgi:hypothetical protein